MNAIWRNIAKYRGNAEEIERLFNLFPLVEAFIEDSIGLQLHKSNIRDSLDIVNDVFVKFQIDNWQTDRRPKYPSVLQQLSTTPSEISDSCSSNFYFPLDDLIDFHLDYCDLELMMSQPNINTVSVPTPASTGDEFNVDLIDLDSLETLIQAQQQKDLAAPRQEPEDLVSQTQSAVNTNMYLHRLDVKRIFKTPEKTCDTFKRFFIALKKVDPHASIRPVYAGDANRVPVINSSIQVQNPELLDISKYHNRAGLQIKDTDYQDNFLLSQVSSSMT